MTEYYPRLFWFLVEASLKKVKWNEMTQNKTKQNKKREAEWSFLRSATISIICPISCM